jgi:hypothetical protein
MLVIVGLMLVCCLLCLFWPWSFPWPLSCTIGVFVLWLCRFLFAHVYPWWLVWFWFTVFTDLACWLIFCGSVVLTDSSYTDTTLGLAPLISHYHWYVVLLVFELYYLVCVCVVTYWIVTVLLLAGNVPCLVHVLTWSVLIDPSILVCLCWLICDVVAWYTDTCQLGSGILLSFLLPLSILCY